MWEQIGQFVNSVGFPITACIGLGWFCKYMIDQNNKNVQRMCEMYAKANEENRQAIEKMTVAVDKLCEKLDKEEK